MPETRDYDELLRTANPVTGERSRTEIDAALARVLRDLPELDAGRRRRWRLSPVRLALASGVLAVATGLVLAVTGLVSPSGSPGGVSNAWAQRVIARAAAVISGPHRGFLHIDDKVVNRIPASGRYAQYVAMAGETMHGSYELDFWQQQTRPYDYWETNGRGLSQTIINGRTETYDARTNVLTEDPKISVSAARIYEASNNPTFRDEQLLSAIPRYRSSGVLVARLLKAHTLTVKRDASVNGQPAIRIAETHNYRWPLNPTDRTEALSVTEAFYVNPRTYAPLEWVVSERAGHGRTYTLTSRFVTYRALPAGSVSIPNLRKLHPDASVVKVHRQG
jgi:hypothetical protein